MEYPLRLSSRICPDHLESSFNCNNLYQIRKTSTLNGAGFFCFSGHFLHLVYSFPKNFLTIFLEGNYFKSLIIVIFSQILAEPRQS